MEAAVITALRARGVDATTALEAATTSLSDVEQIEFAHGKSRALFSFNVSDFCRIHTQFMTEGKSHAGIILAPQQRYSIGERVRRLLILLAATSAEDMQNRLEFLSNWS
jgi:hypothetical protein